MIILKKAPLKALLLKMTDQMVIEWIEGGTWDELGRGEYHCRHFSIRELVDRATLSQRGEAACWALFDVETLVALDWLRIHYGSCTVNGGNFTQSGYRVKGSVWFNEKSMHTVGRAMDCKFKSMTAMEVRASIIDRIRTGFYVPPAIKRMENRVRWFHFDNKIQRDGFEDRWIIDPQGVAVCYLFHVAAQI